MAALLTPLGPIAGDRTLGGVAPADRLDELAFELPLAGGTRPRASLEPGAIAELLRAHLGSDDPVGAYAERLEDPLLSGELRGFLTGSIDLVLRVSAGGRTRYVVVDYKTNWLGPAESSLTLAHYQPEVLREEMIRAHYVLQALLYSAALHRFLRWRQVGYSAAEHLGGVLYLFLRGMAGPDTPVEKGTPLGVFGWRPPPPLVEALSDLLDTGTSRGSLAGGAEVPAGAAVRANPTPAVGDGQDDLG